MKIVRLDSNGFLSLGDVGQSARYYSVTTENNKIILEPHDNVPLREEWSFKNQIAVQRLLCGAEDTYLSRIYSDKNTINRSDNDDK